MIIDAIISTLLLVAVVVAIASLVQLIRERRRRERAEHREHVLWWALADIESMSDIDSALPPVLQANLECISRLAYRTRKELEESR